MQKCSVHNEIVGATPSLLGVNVEVQEDWEHCNLWDWLADSNATVIREFHPEKCMRKQLFAVADFAGINGRKDFDSWRERVKADPETLIPWDLYSFSEPVKWLGIPDGIMSKLGEIHVPALVSMGYYTRMFPLQLIDFEQLSSDKSLLECIDWKSAAPAYEYYFAMLQHFAGRFGNTRFTLHNEPEYDLRKFYCLGQRSDEDGSSEIQEKYWRMNVECAALCLIARLAMEDVREILTDRSTSDNLFLGGPAWHRYWNDYWNVAHEWADACDFHHYHPVSGVFQEIYQCLRVPSSHAPTSALDLRLSLHSSMAKSTHSLVSSRKRL